MSNLASAGSQRWLQVAVNQRREILNRPLATLLGLSPGTHIDWMSPLKSEGYREYRDGAALRRLGVHSLPNQQMSDFWPARGPVWDALARTSDGRLVFVEAKAHIGEAASPSTNASPESRKLIEQSLLEVRSYLAPHSKADWTATFYQYTNRLAWLYLLRQANALPAHMVFLYFLNADEVGGPSEVAEWQGAIQLLHAVLGLGKHPLSSWVHDLFLDVRALK
jgi:hypothetical protein